MNAPLDPSDLAPAPGPSRRFVAGMTAASAVLLALAILGFGLNAVAPSAGGQARPAQLMLDAAPFWFLLVGGFLVIRRPANLTSWALWLLAIAITSGTVAQGVLNGHADGRGFAPALVAWCLWVEGSTWILWFLCLFELLLHFPDGRLPGRRWRSLEALAALDAVAVVAVCSGLRTDPDYPDVINPLTLGPLSRIPPSVANVVISAGFVLMLVAIAITVVGIGLRFHRAHGVERAQLKWLLFGAGFAVAVLGAQSLLHGILGAGMPGWLESAGDILSEASLWTLPLAIAVAVLRYGLFEIDRIVSRTVSYAVVVALLAGAYVAVVAGVSALVPDRYGSVPVVLATLAVSALFLPVRRRVIRVVDRRFNRSRYDAARVVSAFAEGVRGRAGTGTTGEDLLAATQRVLQPAHASVWLAPPGERS